MALESNTLSNHDACGLSEQCTDLKEGVHCGGVPTHVGLKLQGYCYIASRISCFKQLNQLYHEPEHYHLHQVFYPEATEVTLFLLDKLAYQIQVLCLQAGIKCNKGNLPGARSLLEQLLCWGNRRNQGKNGYDGQLNLGCLLSETVFQVLCVSAWLSLPARPFLQSGAGPSQQHVVPQL